jgi:NitT/TauT family transport system ATP-binding protein
MTQTEAFSPDAAAPVLQARGAAFGYAPGKAVFEDVSLSIAPREIVCLLGGSGCGKSSLLRVLGGLESPEGGAWSRGELQFLDQPLTAPHPRAAFVFQQPSLLPWLDARRNVGFGLDFARQPQLHLTQGSKPRRRTRKHRRRAKAPDPLARRRRDHGEPSRD